VQTPNKLQLGCAAADPGAAVRHPGDQITSSFLMVVGLRRPPTQHVEVRHRQLRGLARAGSISRLTASAISRVRLAVRHAHLAGSVGKLASVPLTPLTSPRRCSAELQISGASWAAPGRGNSSSPTITESTLMRTSDQFGAILLKVLPDGFAGAPGDVAPHQARRRELQRRHQVQRQPALGIATSSPRRQRAQYANLVRARIAGCRRISRTAAVVYPNDVTPIIRISCSRWVKNAARGIALAAW